MRVKSPPRIQQRFLAAFLVWGLNAWKSWVTRLLVNGPSGSFAPRGSRHTADCLICFEGSTGQQLCLGSDQPAAECWRLDLRVAWDGLSFTLQVLFWFWCSCEVSALRALEAEIGARWQPEVPVLLLPSLDAQAVTSPNPLRTGHRRTHPHVSPSATLTSWGFGSSLS